MPYITSIEQYGIEQGLQKGIEQGRLMTRRELLLELLMERFGELPKTVRQRVELEADVALLKQWYKKAATCPRLEDLKI
jgi:hypothetical protein